MVAARVDPRGPRGDPAPRLPRTRGILRASLLRFAPRQAHPRRFRARPPAGGRRARRRRFSRRGSEDDASPARARARLGGAALGRLWPRDPGSDPRKTAVAKLIYEPIGSPLASFLSAGAAAKNRT